MALGNSMAAWSEGWASVHYNPAALALSKEIEFSLGVNYVSHNIQVKYAGGAEQQIVSFPGKIGSIENIAGPSMGLLLPVQRLTERTLPTPIAMGVGIFVPQQSLSSTLVVEQSLPVDVMFQDRNSSLALDFALSTRISPAFYIGVGLSTQLRTGGELRISDSGITDAFQYNVRFGAPSVLAGILVRPTERIRIGFVYRQKNYIRSSWNALVQTRISLTSAFGPPISLYKQNALEKSYVSAFTPENFSLGGAYKITERWKVSAQVDWFRWSQYDGPLDQPLMYGFNDIFIPRVGASYRATRKLELRAGFSYEPTPVTSQAVGFYPVGNDRMVPSAGAGYRLDVPWNLLSQPVMIDAFIQYHILQDRSFSRAATSGPVLRDSSLTASGSVLNVGCSLTFRF
jgi:long-subunit fatty acid transport protein